MKALVTGIAGVSAMVSGGFYGSLASSMRHGVDICDNHTVN